MLYLIDEKVKAGIYCIKHAKKNRIYVGSSEDLKRRYGAHLSGLRRNKYQSPYLQNDWNKSEENDFTFELLEEVKDLSKILKREQFWIDLHFDNKAKCYNCSPTAGNTKGKKHTKETIKKMRRIQRKKAIPFEVVSPKGVRHLVENGTHAFANENKLDRRALQQLRTGKRKSHKGWRLYANKEYVPQNSRILQINLVSPDGIVVEQIKSVRKFCRDNNLDRNQFRLLLLGKKQECSGWMHG